MPGGFVGGRYPVGVSFLGRMWTDRRMLALAYALRTGDAPSPPAADSAVDSERPNVTGDRNFDRLTDLTHSTGCRFTVHARRSGHERTAPHDPACRCHGRLCRLVGRARGLAPGRCRFRISSRAHAALRPAVMGPSGGVSTGHPLTTAAAFGILLKGGNAFDAGVASLLAGGVLEQDLYSLGGEALVLVYPKKEGKVTSVVGQGWAPQRGRRRLVSVAQEEPAGRGARSRGRPGRAARRAHGAREVGHDELRGGGDAGDRLRGEGLSAAARARRARSRAQLQVLRALAGQPEVLAQARRLAVQAGRDDQAADDWRAR